MMVIVGFAVVLIIDNDTKPHSLQQHHHQEYQQRLLLSPTLFRCSGYCVVVLRRTTTIYDEVQVLCRLSANVTAKT